MQGSGSFLAEFDTIRFAWCYRTWQFLCFKNWQDRIRDIRLQHRRMKAIGSSLNSLVLRSRIFLYVIKVLNIRLIYFINFHVRCCLPSLPQLST